MIITTMTSKPVALPLATIASAQKVEDGWVVTDSQGEEHEVSNAAWDMAVEGTPVATIPALAGTYLIGLGEDDNDKPAVWKKNVLGWMVCADTQTRPVVLDPEALLSSSWQVLHPDGRVERSDGQAWGTLEEWKAEVTSVQQSA